MSADDADKVPPAPEIKHQDADGRWWVVKGESGPELSHVGTPSAIIQHYKKMKPDDPDD